MLLTAINSPHPNWLVIISKLLLSLVALGAIGTAIGGRTFASFNARITNSGNTFSTGTVLMSNAGTSACTQVNSGNCGTVILSSNTGITPGDSATGTIAITNSGSLPATMVLVASKDAATSTGFNAFLNLTIHDDTTGFCVYGHTSLPFSGACDGLAGLTAQQANDAFPSTNTANLALPGTGGVGTAWAAGEAHNLTVTVEFITTGTTQTSKTGSLDLSWTGTQTAGTSS